MHIHFTGHHIDITPALKTFTQEKFDKLIRHFHRISSIEVILTVEKLRHIAEATILIDKAKLHATAEEIDMYSAIEHLSRKLEQQLLKHKGKTSNHQD